MIELILPDGAKLSVAKGTNGFEAASQISQGLAKKALAVTLNGVLQDVTQPLSTGGSFSVITPKDPEGLEILRHTAAHVLAQAVETLYPSAKATIGPVIENGFYYDFAGIILKEDDLPKIEAEMAKIVTADYPISRQMMSRADAVSFFEKRGEPYKVEIIQDLPPEVSEVSLYTQGDYVELCRGPHLPRTGLLGKAFKLTKVAAAYWRGDAKRESLQRVYGTAFFNEKDLKAYFTLLEEAEKRDHRKLGKEMDLFHFEEYAPGDVFWHPRGWTLFQTLIDYMRKRQKAVGYVEINTPQLMNRVLWETSGHWNWYKENMFTTTIEDRAFALKPMNCPGGVLVFKHNLTSYRDLPQYIGEFGRVHRNEASGAIHGLMRVRAFTQDDAHIFCTPEQFHDELQKVVKLMVSIYHDFGLTDMTVKLSTRPEERIGSDEIWDFLENGLAEAITDLGYPYEINAGDGAFYGPKLDFKFRDAIGREWQLGTLQADLNLPERFDVTYVGEDGQKHRPIMLHRALFGSLERFIATYIEVTKGVFPIWLAPVQAMIMPITKDQNDYAEKIAADLSLYGIRVETDLRNEKISYKIREHALKKIPVMVVVGNREKETQTVTVRRFGSEKQETLSLQAFIKMLRLENRYPSVAYPDLE